MAEHMTAARAAALWWAEQVGAPVYQMTGPSDDPKDQQAGFLAGAMASMIADKHPVDADTAQRFADALERRIREALGRCGSGVSLRVDYGPDLMLAAAEAEAGIHRSRFPWKTRMIVRTDHVIAALGYGRPWRLVWSAPGWDRPACGSHRYDDDREPLDEVCPRPRYHDGECGEWRPDPARCARCGGGYRDHFGPDSDLWTHPWTPEEEAVDG